MAGKETGNEASSRTGLSARLVTMFMVVCAIGVPFQAQAREPPQSHRSLDQRLLIRTVAELYDIDADLFEAISRVESSGDPAAVSPKGALGLMQLMPATARDFMVEDPFDPLQNVLGAARFILYIRHRQALEGNHEFHLPEVVAAYNAGEGAVEKYGGIPPYPETRSYVRRVLERYLLGDSGPALRQWRKAAASSTIVPSPRKLAKRKGLRHRLSGCDPDLSLLGQLAQIRENRDSASRLTAGPVRLATGQ